MTNKTILRSLILVLSLGICSSYAFAEAPAVDNSGVNKRDMNSGKLTPEDQYRGTAQDVELTRRIREQLTKDSQLSTYAQNIKIITLNGMVTLRGPVRSQTESAKIVQTAQNLAGSERTIKNELEIKPEHKR